MDEYDYGHTIGEQAAEWIKDTLDGKAQVCIISQDNVESVIPRGDGVEEAFKKRSARTLRLLQDRREIRWKTV